MLEPQLKPVSATTRRRMPIRSIGLLVLPLAAMTLAAVSTTSGNAPPSAPASIAATADRTQSFSAALAAGGEPNPRMSDVPADTSLEAVSKSHPSPGAARALLLCNGQDDLDMVSGMAQLPADRLRHFMYTNGNEPELQTDALVWAVQFRGDIQLRNWDVIDPTCVVIDDQPIFYAGYGTVGESYVAPSGFQLPSVALPSLAP